MTNLCRKTPWLPLLTLLLLAPLTAQAAIAVSLKLDRRQATLADSVTMIVSVSGTRDSDVTPVLAGVEDFHVSSGGTSSRVQIINGKMDSSVDFTYYLQPKKTGTFTIGPVTLKRKGQTFTSNTAVLLVTQHIGSSDSQKGSIFLEAALSSDKAYVEEQVIYTLRLFRQIKVSDVSLNIPEISFLIFKKLGEATQYRSVRQGQTYQVLEVRYAVIASKPGQYVIEPATMGMTVYQPRHRSRHGFFGDPFFDDPFFSFSAGRPMTLASEPLEMDVVPLPAAGRPADFSGLVGSFHISASLDPAEVKSGESATLTVHIIGHGDVNRIPDLSMPKPASTKVYADQPVLDIKPDENGLAGTKTMKWALVPEKAGQYQIAPMSLTFFDTKSHTYRRAQTTPFLFSVLPGTKKQQPPPVDVSTNRKKQKPNKQEVTALGHDILPIHTSVTGLSFGGPVVPKGWTFLAILILPCFVYAAALCSTICRRRSRRTLSATRARKAAKRLMKKCSQDDLTASDFLQVVRDYFNDRFNLALGSLTPSEAADILMSRGASRDTANKVKAALQETEDAIYTGKGARRYNTGNGISKLITVVEKEVR